MSDKDHYNSLFDFWYHILGVNCIPFNSKDKVTYEQWSKWQDQPVPVERYENWKKDGSFDKGIAIICGKIWRGAYKDKYLACIDIDDKKGIEEFLIHFGEYDNLEKLSQKTIVEQHKDDPNRAHIYFIVEKPLAKKSGMGMKHTNKDDNNEVPAIEVKSVGKHGTVIVSPSIHRNGHPYEIIGNRVPTILNTHESEKLDLVLLDIYEKFGNNREKKQASTLELFDDKFTILEGQNRQDAVLRVCNSLIQRLKAIYPIEKIKKLASEWNQESL